MGSSWLQPPPYGREQLTLPSPALAMSRPVCSPGLLLPGGLTAPTTCRVGGYGGSHGSPEARIPKGAGVWAGPLPPARPGTPSQVLSAMRWLQALDGAGLSGKEPEGGRSSAWTREP